MNHELKTDPAIFRAIRDGRMNFNIRKDDRAFQTGDTVELKCHDIAPPPPWTQPNPPPPPPGAEIKRRITFVLRGGQYGLETGYVGLALEVLE